MSNPPIRIGDTVYTEATVTINLSDYTGIIDKSDKTTSYEQNILVPGSSDIPPQDDTEYNTKKYDTLIQVIKLCQNNLTTLLLENLNLDDLRLTKYGRMDSLQKQVTIRNPSTKNEGVLSVVSDALSSLADGFKCAFKSCPKSPAQIENEYNSIFTDDVLDFEKTLSLPQLEYLSFNLTIVNIGFIYYILLAKQRAVLNASQGTRKNIQYLDYLDLSGTNLSVSEEPINTSLAEVSSEKKIAYITRILNQLGTEKDKNPSLIPYTNITTNDLYNIFTHIAPNLKILKLSNSQLRDPLLFYYMLNEADELVKLTFKQNSKPDLTSSGLKFSSSKPFSSLKVIDFSNVSSGPLPENITTSTPNFEISQYTVHNILINSINLEELYLAGNDLEKFSETINNPIPNLPNLTKLKILRLDNTNITSGYLTYLLEHTPNLQVLGLNSDTTTILDLSKNITHIDSISPIISNLTKLSELYINIIGLTDDQLKEIIEKIIKPIETLKTLELPYIQSFDYGYLAFREYNSVILYDNTAITNALTNKTKSNSQRNAEIEAAIGNITNQINNMYKENMGITDGSGLGGSTSNSMMLIVIIFVVLLIAGIGGFFLFKKLNK